jgi:xylulokinase
VRPPSSSSRVCEPTARALDDVRLTRSSCCPPARSSFDFSRVVSISGAGQQHACVLFNNRASQLLRSLKPAKPLASQLKDAFASPTVTNWQDSSTTRECAALESGLPGGRDELARLTGSKAHERFTGPQIRKLVTRGVGDVWAETAKIALVSNALATILCADGEIKPYDEVSCASLSFGLRSPSLIGRARFASKPGRRVWHESLLVSLLVADRLCERPSHHRH